LAEQVGVKAPGTPKTTTVLPPNSASVVISFGPSAVPCMRLMLGMLSPT
jgi:hypothetical protein